MQSNPPSYDWRPLAPELSQRNW